MKRSIALSFLILHFSFFIYSQNAATVVSYSFEPVVQHFTVPFGVNTITIIIAGAQGGGFSGGNGASFTGVCTVYPSQVLSVVVGQRGEIGSVRLDGGGGGASWVYDSNVVLYNPSGITGLYAVAAGGGGRTCVRNISHDTTLPDSIIVAGSPGGTDLLTNSTTAMDSVYGTDTGGTGGNGGDPYGNIPIVPSGGGGGWLSNGFGLLTPYGKDESNHFSYSPSGGGDGGFGGGGGGGVGNNGNNIDFGGGGGGYNGGGGGGGGGGSYLNGTLVGTATASDTGNGSVTILYYQYTGTTDYTGISKEINIYPNPSTGVFIVNGLSPGQLLDTYNYLGQKINSSLSKGTFAELDLSDHANGVYQLVVHNADGSHAGELKVVKAN